MITGAPMCAFCAHKFKGGPPPTCKAFPEGIPQSIWQSRFDHRRAYAGDRGVRFKVRDGFTVEEATANLMASRNT